MSNITVWNFENNNVRTLELGGIPYFVGKDVSNVLGYSNSRDAILKHVDEDDKDAVAICDTIGREQVMTVINESGVFSLILSSKLPAAKKFKRWVTSEVLPSIRKHGVYSTDDFAKKSVENPAWAIQILTSLQKEREEKRNLQISIDVKNQQIAEFQPKASYYDVVLNCKDLVSITTIAKDYGWSAKTMNAFLHDKGVQFKQGDIWFLYQKYADKGYTSTKTHTYPGNDGETHSRVHTYWTQKGRLFIYGLMKADNHPPLIERK